MMWLSPWGKTMTSPALSFTAGLSIATSDADGVSLTSDSVGSAGFHYYFY